MACPVQVGRGCGGEGGVDQSPSLTKTPHGAPEGGRGGVPESEAG